MTLEEALKPDTLVRRPTDKFMNGETEIWVATETIMYRQLLSETEPPQKPSWWLDVEDMQANDWQQKHYGKN